MKIQFIRIHDKNPIGVTVHNFQEKKFLLELHREGKTKYPNIGQDGPYDDASIEEKLKDLLFRSRRATIQKNHAC